MWERGARSYAKLLPPKSYTHVAPREPGYEHLAPFSWLVFEVMGLYATE